MTAAYSPRNVPLHLKLSPQVIGLFIKFLIAFIIGFSPFNVSPLTSIKEPVFFAPDKKKEPMFP
jgi:hypothetical protein